jgi:ABC-type antimicrobial peptide transport system permease subunit
VVAIGIVFGLGLAALAARGIRSMLFGVAPVDPTVFAGMAGLMVLIGALASWLPALKASRLDPLDAMRG